MRRRRRLPHVQHQGMYVSRQELEELFHERLKTAAGRAMRLNWGAKQHGGSPRHQV